MINHNREEYFLKRMPNVYNWVTLLYSRDWHNMVNQLLGFPGGTSGKESACQCRRHRRCRFDPWIRTMSWRGARQSTPVFLENLPLENPRDKGAWWATVHRVAKSWTWLKGHSSSVPQLKKKRKWETNLKNTMLSEISQTQKDKHCMISFIYGI